VAGCLDDSGDGDAAAGGTAPEPTAAELVDAGRTAKDDGRLDDAERSLRRALELRPRDGEARALLGNVLASSGRHEAAAAEFRRAIVELALADSGPQLERAHYQLARSLRALGRNDEAAAHFAEHRRLHDGAAERDRLARRAAQYPSARTYVELGLLRYRDGQFVSAARTFRAALELVPTDCDAKAALALALAETDLERARKLVPTDDDCGTRAGALLASARVHELGGEIDAARRALERARRSAGGDNDAFAAEIGRAAQRLTSKDAPED